MANLKDYIERISRGEFRLTESTTVNKLSDEYEPSIFTRFSRHVVNMALTIWFNVTKEEILPIVSVIGTMMFILLIGYFLNYMVGDNRARVFEPVRFDDK